MLNLEYIAEDDCEPSRAHNSDAGLDLVCSEYTILEKNVRQLVPTGVRVAIPTGFMGLLVPRSGLSKRGIIMTNSAGIIDSDYRGEIKASLMYIDSSYETLVDKWCPIQKGERIVQLIIVPIVFPVLKKWEGTWNEWESSTTRGAGGFGSTGI